MNEIPREALDALARYANEVADAAPVDPAPDRRIVLPPPPPLRERPAHAPKWAAAVLTAPRPKSYLLPTLNSIRRAGWHDVWIFADRGAFVPSIEKRVTRSTAALGAYGNHLAAITQLLHSRETCDAEWFLLCEDDVEAPHDREVFPESFRVWLEREVLSPGPIDQLGFISLFTAVGAARNRPPGWHKWPNVPLTHIGADGLWFGAQAIVMHRWTLARYLHSELLASHREIGQGAGVTFADHALSRWCSREGLDQWFAVGAGGSSFFAHKGEASTLWPGIGVRNFYRGEVLTVEQAAAAFEATKARLLPICEPCDYWEHDATRGMVRCFGCSCADPVTIENIGSPPQDCPIRLWRRSP